MIESRIGNPHPFRSSSGNPSLERSRRSLVRRVADYALATTLLALLPQQALAVDCAAEIPMDEWVQCDADGARTEFRTWSASVAGGGRIWHWGGGHDDYSGNGVLIYDIATDTWEQATTNESWRDSTVGGFDSYLDEWTEAEHGPDCYTEKEKEKIQNAFRNGEVQQEEETLLGRPFVRHVYNDRMYWPETGMFCTGVSGFWCYDPSEGNKGGGDVDCEYSDTDNVAWTRFTDENVQEPNVDGLESTAYSYDAELNGGSLVVFGGAADETIKTSTDGVNWSTITNDDESEFKFGTHIGFGLTVTAYAENRGLHFVGISVNQGPDNDQWFQIDLSVPQSTTIPGPLEAAGATSGFIIAFSYDPGSQTLLAYGKFEGDFELWQYNPDSAAWAQLDLGGTIPTTETTGDRFDYLNYDATTGRHYLLRGASLAAPIEVYAFRISDPPIVPSEDGDTSSDDGGGGGSLSFGVLLAALLTALFRFDRRLRVVSSARRTIR